MRIYVAGHRGMVGGAILRRLETRQAAGEDLTLITRTSSELDLTSQTRCGDFGRGQSGWHYGQQHVSCTVHL